MKRKNLTAVVTGASSGVGKAYALLLAAQGYDLIITGRRAKLLKQVSDEITLQYPVNIRIILGDLSDPGHRTELIELVKNCGNVDYLVNNAGFGIDAPFQQLRLEEIHSMISTHVIATSDLIYAVMPGMTSRGRGHIINVSSLCTFLPGLSRTLYLATKAYIHYFSRALNIELAESGINVQSLCLGFVKTDFFRAVKTKDPGHNLLEKFFLTPEEVVIESHSAAQKGRSICIPGSLYKIGYMFARVLPFAVFGLLNHIFSKKMMKTEAEQHSMALSVASA